MSDDARSIHFRMTNSSCESREGRVIVRASFEGTTPDLDLWTDLTARLREEGLQVSSLRNFHEEVITVLRRKNDELAARAAAAEDALRRERVQHAVDNAELAALRRQLREAPQ